MVSLGEGYVLPPNDTGAAYFRSLGWQGTPLARSHSHLTISTDTSFWTTPTEPHAGSRILFSASKTAIVPVCSGQLIPDTALSFSSATAGARPSLN